MSFYLRYAVFKVQMFRIRRFLSFLLISQFVLTLQFFPSGDEGIRTPDPLLARQVLSQLSYTPGIPAATCSPISSPI